jgi:hypothetical protein
LAESIVSITPLENMWLLALAPDSLVLHPPATIIENIEENKETNLLPPL